MSYIQGFVVPVPVDKKDAYRKMAAAVAPIFREYGAERMVECWGDYVPDGQITDFKRAVQATPEENVVLSWVVWPSKDVCEAASQKIMNDSRMQREMPFDGKRMIFGGFDMLFDTGA